ncbi:hypothetical protein EJ377_15615 [Chryseobacterium arthrosphaerae]|uniref:Cation/H+ exchanger transmembrane domain-containing protein n=1 Tax=Chryseobacterium arthrosphaerae TaxID=651561 RepID=A0A3S0N199_9FLAO|nr:hypothetical protein EJ377_15615 [Chryseobacterium arthrosphaerae]
MHIMPYYIRVDVSPKRLNQPYMIAYIIAGVVLGPHVSGVFTNPEEIETIGEVGILLLMFSWYGNQCS